MYQRAAFVEEKLSLRLQTNSTATTVFASTGRDNRR